jgi:hypothetical protein
MTQVWIDPDQISEPPQPEHYRLHRDNDQTPPVSKRLRNYRKCEAARGQYRGYSLGKQPDGLSPTATWQVLQVQIRKD